ncbi:MAG: hypothetical protein WCX60_02635 [Anaerovoracaceae bacterium]
MINQIRPNQPPGLAKTAAYDKEYISRQNEKDEQKVSKPKADAIAFTKKNEPVAATYSNLTINKKLDSSDIASLKSMAEQANENLRRIVEQLILKQGKSHKIFQVRGFSHQGEASTKDIEEARLAISEDGEFGVKAVSDRLVEFAKSVSGGDKSKYEELKGAIDQGFQAAKEALGGYLPDISHETYRETMRKLEIWAMEV